jgi:hypothetical protein
MAGSGQNAGDAFAVTKFVIPDNFAGAVVEGAQSGIGPEVNVAAGPAFGLAGRGEVKNAEDAAGGDVEKAGLGIEAGRHPIAGTVGTGLDERAVRAGCGFGLGDGTAAGVNALGPCLVDEGSGDQVLAIGAIEEKVKSVAAGLREELARFAIEFGVEQNGSLDGVPVMDVMWRGLEIPGEFSGVWIQRDDGAGVEIIAGSGVACEDRIGIAGAPVERLRSGS